MRTRRLIARVRPLLSYFTHIPTLRKFLKKFGLAVWRWDVKFSSRGMKELPDPNKLYWISPQQIELVCALQNYDKYKDRGRVVAGDWDKNTTLFSDLDVYKGLEARFIQGANWEDTDFYQRVVADMASGEVKWGCKSKSDFDTRLQELELLLEKIKVQGYKSQSELVANEDVSFLGEDEITVRIDRHGRPLFEDGRHRLAIAKLLDLDRVSIKVTARHTDWYDFIREIRSYAITHNGKVYQPLTHFDLCEIPSLHGNERFDLISMHMPLAGGELLDIGAHWGYFCHRFDDVGFDCFAVESNHRAGYFLEKLKLAEGKNFKVILKSIFEYQDKNDFDVVLALNIFHHFLKTEELFVALIEFLQWIQTRVMFFQTHQPESSQMDGAYRNFRPEEFVSFVQQYTGLNRVEYLGTAPDNRSIFMLTQEK